MIRWGNVQRNPLPIILHIHSSQGAFNISAPWHSTGWPHGAICGKYKKAFKKTPRQVPGSVGE